MVAVRDLEQTKERLLSFAEYAKDAQPEILVTLIQSIIERIYIVEKDDERFCHIFIKGCTGEDYTGFFQTAGYIEHKSAPTCDSEQYCICTKISPSGNLQRHKYLLRELSEYIQNEFGKGFSADNLKLMRRFYLVYSNDQIGETVFPQFKNLPAVESGRKFYLSWSHYLKLMRIENADERHFYEIEAVKNDWSLSELRRQFDSALYERLALSRDKDEAKELATKGQVIETPSDAVKDPYVLEFLGLPEQAAYSETELESRIIDHLQQFLPELGTGFTFVGRQVRFTFDEKHFRVDLVFFNRILRCFVLFNLKIGELKHQDLGQISKAAGR